MLLWITLLNNTDVNIIVGKNINLNTGDKKIWLMKMKKEYMKFQKI